MDNGEANYYELIPYIETLFMGQGEGCSRFLYGGSTGGWKALAVQIKYPNEYNGCFAACPDPIDFRSYCLINIYKVKDAYYYQSEYKNVEIPAPRNYLGDITSTMKQDNYLELVLGDKSGLEDNGIFEKQLFLRKERMVNRKGSGIN